MSETKEQVKHTPGPWAIARLAEEVISPILSRNGYTGAFPVAARPEYEDSDETWEANARLIATAPELLEDGNWMHAVLLQVEKHLTQDERDHLGEIALNLAKAEGR